MKRSKEMQKFVNEFTKKAFGKTQTEFKEQGTCPTCQKPVGEFRDQLSHKEYLISGMCQDCQDSVFGK